MNKFFQNKKLLIFFATILTIFVVGAAGLVFLNEPKESEIDFNTFTLVNDSGVVEYKSENDQNYSIVEGEVDLPSGTSIKTSEESLAYVFFPDNSLVTIESGTEITIVVEKDKINIDQIIGNTWHRVKTVTNGGEYNVKTPDTIASVRGTIFAVKAQTTEGTNVYVLESNVDVAGSGIIGANKYAQVQNYNEVEAGEIEEETTKSEWFKRNSQVDEIYNINDSKEKEKNRSFKKEVLKKIENKKVEDKKEGVLGEKTEKENTTKNKFDLLKQKQEAKKLRVERESINPTTPDRNNVNIPQIDTNRPNVAAPIVDTRPVPVVEIARLENVRVQYDSRSQKFKFTWEERNLSRTDSVLIMDSNTGEQVGNVSSGLSQYTFESLPLGTHSFKVCLNDCSRSSTVASAQTDRFKIYQADGNTFKIQTPNGQIGLDQYFAKGFGFYFHLFASSGESKQPAQDYALTLRPVEPRTSHKIKLCVYKDYNRNGLPDSNEPCVAYSDVVDNVILN